MTTDSSRLTHRGIPPWFRFKNRIHFNFTQQRRVDTSESLYWSWLLLQVRHLQRYHAANGCTNTTIAILSSVFQIRLPCGAIRVHRGRCLVERQRWCPTKLLGR
jgi:hypothetical protein